jgi:hypothetical protein
LTGARETAAPLTAPSVDASKPADPPATTTVPAATPQPGPAAAAPEAPATTPEAPAAPAEPPPAPPRPASGTVPVKPAVPDGATVAGYRARIEGLLAKGDPREALATLTDALAYAPGDRGLRAIGVKVADQARDKAGQERSKAVAQRASGLPKFREGDRTVQRGGLLSRNGNSAASARAYLDAASLFASSAADAAKRRAGGGSAGGDQDDTAPETAPAPGPAAAAPPPKTEPPVTRAEPSGSVDTVLDAYVAAIARGDRAALLAVYPTAPADLLATLGKRPGGSDVQIADRFIIRDSRGLREVKLTLVYQSNPPSGTRQDKTEKLVLILEPSGNSWKVIASRPQ